MSSSAIFGYTSDSPPRRPAAGAGRPKQVPNVAIPGFQLRRVVGTGGMGAVYEAFDERLGRVVAVKLLHSAGLTDPRADQRFRAEAQAVARLAHPNAVQVHHFGEVDGSAYLVMEFVDGPNLLTAADGRPAPVATAVRLIREAAEAVGAAHRAGVVHRDLKPANLLLAGPDLSAPIRVTDFGMARLLGENPEHSQDGTVGGTPGYMAPEQCLAAGAVGPWTDVYALGVVLYELLTGRLPLTVDVPEQYLTLVQTTPPLPPRAFRPDLPADLVSVVLKCLAKQPRDRYLTADDLAADLGRFERGLPVTARPLGAVAAALRAARRYPFAAALSVSTVLSLAAGMTASTLLYRQAEAARRRAAEAAAATAASLERETAARQAAEQQTALANRQISHGVFVRDFFFDRGLDEIARRTSREGVAAGIREVADRGEKELADNPTKRRWLRLLTGQTLVRLGDAAGGERCFRLLLADGTEDNLLGRMSAAFELAELLARTGRGTEALAVAEAGLAEAVGRLGPHDPRTVNLRLATADALAAVGRRSEAVAQATQAVADHRSHYPPDRAGVVRRLVRLCQPPLAAVAGGLTAVPPPR